jgi:hypothetical protein
LLNEKQADGRMPDPEGRQKLQERVSLVLAAPALFFCGGASGKLKEGDENEGTLFYRHLHTRTGR